VALSSKADRAALPVIACTLVPAEAAERIGDWQRVLARATVRTEVAGGVALRFPADAGLAAEIATLSADEQACCSFFTFTITMSQSGTTLTVTAPADAAALVGALFGRAA
jgi:hypothetical protein